MIVISHKIFIYIIPINYYMVINLMCNYEANGYNITLLLIAYFIFNFILNELSYSNNFILSCICKLIRLIFRKMTILGNLFGKNNRASKVDVFFWVSIFPITYTGLLYDIIVTYFDFFVMEKVCPCYYKGVAMINLPKCFPTILLYCLAPRI